MSTPQNPYQQDPHQPQDPHRTDQYPVSGTDQYPAAQYGPSGYGTQEYPYAQPLPPMPAQPSGPSRARLIGASAAAVVLVGGGAATYVAVSASESPGGAGNPKAAVQHIVGDLNNSDLIGLFDDLAPGERAAFAGPLKDAVGKLKDDKVLSSSADPSNLAGIDVAANDLTYGAQTVPINDHVQVVQLTGGTLHVSADASKLPLTSEFLKAVAPGGLPSDAKQDKSVDIGAYVKRTGKPVSIATQKVGGRWYPSLFYTIAYYATQATHTTAPTAAERIPDKGASSPDDAVRTLVQSLLSAQLANAIAVLSPDELGVLHDYGKLIVDRALYQPVPATIKTLDFTDSDADGGTLVALKDLDIAFADGPEFKVQVQDSCFVVTAERQAKRFCASDLADRVGSTLERTGQSLTPAQHTALIDLFSGISQVGTYTAQHDGKWYVTPVRGLTELGVARLDSLHGNDLISLLSLMRGAR